MYSVIISEKLRLGILQDLHRSHLGMNKTKSLSISYFWWPNLDRDIENSVKNCKPCVVNSDSPNKSILILWENTGSTSS